MFEYVRFIYIHIYNVFYDCITLHVQAARADEQLANLRSFAPIEVAAGMVTLAAWRAGSSQLDSCLAAQLTGWPASWTPSWLAA